MAVLLNKNAKRVACYVLRVTWLIVHRSSVVGGRFSVLGSVVWFGVHRWSVVGGRYGTTAPRGRQSTQLGALAGQACCKVAMARGEGSEPGTPRLSNEIMFTVV